MKAAILTQKERFELLDIPIPVMDDTDVMVKITDCSVCNSTDAKLFHGKHKLSVYPMLIGHECAGIVYKIGRKVTRWKEGDRVLGSVFKGTRQFPAVWGGYAEFGVCNETALLPIPDGVGLTEATLAVMLGETLNAVRIAEVKPGDTVGIIGCGAVGLSLLSVVQHFLPQTIIALDISDEKLARAKQMGADVTLNTAAPDIREQIDVITGGNGLNKIFEAVGKKDTYELMYDTAARNGIIVPFGIVNEDIQVPFQKIYSRQVQIRWCSAAGDYGSVYKSAALKMLQRGFIDKGMITSVTPLEQIGKVFERIALGRETRAVIQMNGGKA